MLLPAMAQKRIQIRARMQAWMDIAIDDAQPDLRGRFLFKDGTVDDVTHAILLGSSGLRREVQQRKGFERIVFAHTRNEALRQMWRDRVATLELPMRIIVGEQKHL